MALEGEGNVNYIDDLSGFATNPEDGDDPTEGAEHIRLTKKAVYQSFPNVDGAVTVTDTELNTLTGTSLGSYVPVGGIIMFNGTITGLPANWKVCDGNNGTPDLAGSFILGTATQGEITDTGGSADAIVVAHTHTGTTDDPGTHTHTLQLQFAGPSDITTGTGGPVNGSANTGADGDHTHDFTTASTGVSGTGANLPPYYKLAYIMRIS